MLFRAQLLNDIGEEILNCFCFRLTSNDEGVILNAGVGFWSAEVQDCVVISKEVNLINSKLLGSSFFD